MQITTVPNITQSRLTRRALRAGKVLEKTGLSKTHLYRLIQQGRFPAGTRLSERVVVWDENIVDDWLAEKFSAGAR